MPRLQRLVSRNRTAVGVAWLLVLAVSIPLTAHQGDRLTTGGFEVSGSQSQAVQHAWRQAPSTAAARTDIGVLIQVAESVDASAWQRLLKRVRRDIGSDGGQVAPGPHPYHAFPNRREALLPLVSPVSDTEHGQRLAKRLTETFESDRYREGQATVIGQGAVRASLDERAKKDLAQAELISAPVLLVILILVFGSLGAALVPLMLGGISVIVTGAVVALLSRQFEMSVFVTNVASMIGIGVAVDYALFIVTRYREARAGGAAPKLARKEAMATSGLAVVFSGTTVVFAVSALWLTDTAATRSMALGATVVVAVAVLACVTLLPLLLVGLAERRSRWTRVSPSPLWGAVVRSALRRPALSASAACLLMLAMAAPALAMSTSEGLLRYFAKTDPLQRATDSAARLGGPGTFAPIEVVLRPTDRNGSVSPAALKRAVETLRSQHGVYEVSSVRRLGSKALVRAALSSDPESAAAKRQVADIRDALNRSEPVGAKILVGGVTAEQIDLEQHVASSAPWIALFVAVVTYLILLVLTRSLLLPLKALMMTLLTAGAGYGVVVVAFQWGWLEWLGIQAVGDVDLLTPILMLTVVVGLSMDYEVFLLSRIRERYLAGLSPHDAIEDGVARSARTITSAALIMVCVFMVFVVTGVSTVQQLGLGLAVAIALDATVVRMVLLPASMQLLGHWNWWIPGWLQRVLPAPTLLGDARVA